MKTELTAVIYRVFKDSGSVIALFPFEPAKRDGWDCTSYMHVGQHGAACPHLAREGTRPATRKEIAPLKRELLRIGYKLKELKRFPHNAYDVRCKIAHAV